ncbi:MAG: squalene/phytoene synthase family protein [Alphaproteobacteria bacterium]|nr:squalene/phytoene synthase family protein [Alphaproteobacteria bacterium]
MNYDLKKFVKQNDSELFWGIRMLPKAQREAIYTVYAFHCHIENIAYDISLSTNEKLELIKAWREEFDNIYEKKVPLTDIGRKIYKNCMRFKLPKSEFIRFLKSIEDDIRTPITAPNLTELSAYCRGVAGVPCNFSLRILGCEDEPLIEKLSDSISSSIKITHILKNVKDDAELNRLYIPKELLNKAEIFETNPNKVLTDKNLSIARQELAGIAEKSFNKTYALVEELDNKVAKTILGVTNLNKKYFDIMNKRGWEIISPKPKISPLQMFSLAFRVLF